MPENSSISTNWKTTIQSEWRAHTFQISLFCWIQVFLIWRNVRNFNVSNLKTMNKRVGHSDLISPNSFGTPRVWSKPDARWMLSWGYAHISEFFFILKHVYLLISHFISQLALISKSQGLWYFSWLTWWVLRFLPFTNNSPGGDAGLC